AGLAVGDVLATTWVDVGVAAGGSGVGGAEQPVTASRDPATRQVSPARSDRRDWGTGDSFSTAWGR
ncbi:MAG: hypothetical protein WBC14_11260, partial [Propionicimonas sp.]